MKTPGVVMSARMDGEIFNPDDIIIRYYISSAELTAEELATAARNHWVIEGKLHWKPDVAMNEDNRRMRRGNTAIMFAGFRHVAVNMLINTKSFQTGLKRTQKKAAMSTQYLAEVLAGGGMIFLWPSFSSSAKRWLSKSFTSSL